MSPAPGENRSVTSTPRAKRRRLNFACNYCRSRKTRCDEQKPACHACLVAGILCVTVDLRRPNSQVERREAGVTAAVPAEPRHAEPQSGNRPTAVEHAEGHQESRDEAANTPLLDQSARFTGPLTILRKRHARNTLETLATWLDLAVHRLGRPRLALSTLLGGSDLPQSLPIRISGPPRMPNPEVCGILLTTYFETVNVIYPFLEIERMKKVLDHAHTNGCEIVCERYGLATLMQLYLAIVLGAYSHVDLLAARDLDDLGDYCKTLQGHVICHSDIETVRAIALASLNLKFQGRETEAWATLAQSSSIADSICLRSTHDKKPPVLEDIDSGSQVWWTLYCFEKLFALELGHSSNLPRAHENEFTYGSISQSISETKSEKGRVFVIVASLAVTLGNIGARCIDASLSKTNEPDAETDLANIFLKVRTTGECCLLLSQWAREVPSEYSPSFDPLFGEPNRLVRKFISMQYNNTLLMLTRNSLLISEDAIWHATEVVAKGEPWEHIIRNGQAITAKAAREILTIAIDGADSGVRPIIPTISTTLHASFVLYIRTTRHPGARMATTDRTLILDAICQIMDSKAKGNSVNANLYSALDAFKNMIRQLLRADSDLTSRSYYNATYPSGQLLSTAMIASLEGEAETISATHVRGPEGYNPRIAMPPDGRTEVFDGFTIRDDLSSPNLPDYIGWDWTVFSHLLTVPESNAYI